MAEVLTTKGSVAALEDLIRKAEKELYLISYSFIISDYFISRIKQATEKGIIVNLVYGKSIRQDSLVQLKSISNLKIFHLEKLHAKLYANETKCIIGSMNFSEASETSNTEIGVLLSNQYDPEAYKEAIIHCKDIVAESTLERPMLPKTIADKFKNNETPPNTNKIGYCIRTGVQIPFDIEKPLSNEAFKSWNKYKDLDYEESFCHFSGEPSYGETSVSKPILKKNWKKAKEIYGF